MADPSSPLLRVQGVSVRFGGIVALDGVSFDVAAGDICALIGPNGAGKTTLFNCMSRLYPYQSGDILFEGRSITDVPQSQIAGLGLGRTFQNLAMFRTLSVTDNVMVGAHARSSAGFVASALWLPSVKAEDCTATLPLTFTFEPAPISASTIGLTLAVLMDALPPNRMPPPEASASASERCDALALTSRPPPVTAADPVVALA